MPITSARSLVVCASLFASPLAWAQTTAAQPAKPAQTERKVLKAGDPAPAFKVAKWIKGDEVKGFEKGKVYVVDFWATYATTCKLTMPHLTELAKKHKDAATIIGVAIWEETKDKNGPRDPVPAIEKFVNDLGEGVGYRIAYGGPQGEMEASWMRAAEKPGVPTSFIVDKDGRVAWIGTPLQIDEPLAKVIAGTFDPVAEQERLKKQEATMKKLKEVNERAKNAAQGGRAKELLDATRELVSIDPVVVQSLPGEYFRRVLVSMNEPDLAYAYAKEFLEGPGSKYGMAMDMNTMAWVTMDDPGVKKRDMELAMKLATKANEITKEREPAILDTLARAYWEKGDAAKALELSEKAVAIAKTIPDTPAQTMTDMTNALEKYKKGKK